MTGLHPDYGLTDQLRVEALRDYCLATGLKLQAVADKAIQAWLRKASK